MRPIIVALRLAWDDTICRWSAIVGLPLLGTVYAAVLPASMTGGRIGWVSLRLLTPELGILAVALASLLTLTVALMVLIVRHGRRASKAAVTGGALMALVTPLLCCSPVLPLALGALAVAFPAIAGVAAGRMQGYIATHETSLLLVAVGLTAVALYQNARRVASGPHCRIPARRPDSQSTR